MNCGVPRAVPSRSLTVVMSAASTEALAEWKRTCMRFWRAARHSAAAKVRLLRATPRHTDQNNEGRDRLGEAKAPAAKRTPCRRARR